MKKFAILTITLILSLLLVLPALAEDTTAAEEENTVDAIVMDWNQDVIDAFVAAGLDGNIATVTLPDGLTFDMLIPDGFEQRELTEEEEQMGVNLALANEATGAMIRILDCTFEGINDISGIAQSLLTMNPETAIQFALINGKPALIAGMQEDDYDSVNITIDLDNSRFVQFDFAPLEGNNLLAQFFIASIQF